MNDIDSLQPRYLILGRGRLAFHLKFLLSENPASILETWHREQGFDSLKSLAKTPTCILLAVKDEALNELVAQISPWIPKSSRIVSFSGSQAVPGALTLHPLMAFSWELFSREFYQKIHWIETESGSFRKVFPGLNNPVCLLPSSNLALYHALCVCAGNLPLIFLKDLLRRFQELEISQDAFVNYVQGSIENFLKNPEGSLTGPIVRRDHQTIEKNLAALKNTPYEALYQLALQLQTKV